VNKFNLVKTIVKTANLLDEIGLHNEADKMDEVCEKVRGESYMFEPQLRESIKRLQKVLSELENRDPTEEIPDWMETYMATVSDRITSIHDAFMHRI